MPPMSVAPVRWQVSTASVLESFHRQVGPARQAYRRFMQDGLAHGHQDRFYETVDQRFLGDERFIEEVDRRTARHARGALAGSTRVGFGRSAHRRGDDIGGHATGDPGPRTAAGPRPRPRTVGLSGPCNWSHLTTRELGRRLQRIFYDQPVGYGLRRPPRSGHRSARTPGDYRTRFLNKSILRPDPNVLTPRRFATVEPVFGNLRGNKRLSRFSLRGQQKVDGQWKLYCLMRNIEKLAHHGSGR